MSKNNVSNETIDLFKKHNAFIKVITSFLLIGTITVLILSQVNNLWSLSADLAHHYALTYRISDLLSLPSNDPSILEMNNYPPFSHILAAICGKIFGASFLGIQLIALASIIVLWASIGIMIKSLPVKLANLSFFLLAILLFLNKYFFQLEFHGFEVIGNFFFSQLVAQAIFFLLLAILIRSEQISEVSTLRYLIILLFIPLLVWTHLLPALELFGFLFFLIAIDILQTKKESRRKKVFMTIFILLIAMASIIFHPSFSVLKKISEHNGTLNFRYMDSLKDILLVSVFIACTSLFLLYKWLKLISLETQTKYIILKYVGLYGSVASGLCILQLIAFYFGHGAEYAVKKYGFSLNTALLLNFVLFIIYFLQKNKIIKNIESPSKKFKAVDFIVLPLFISISFLSIIPKQKVQDVASLISFTKQLEALYFTKMTKQPEKYDYVIKIKGFPPLLSFLFSITNLKAPRVWDNGEANMDLQNILYDKVPSDFSKIGNIVTSENYKPYDIKECRLFTSANSIVIVDGKCISNYLIKQTYCQGNFDFTDKNWISDSIIQGFSNAENHGSWTDGKIASFECYKSNTGEKQPTKAIITARGYNEANHSQRAIFTINGSKPVEYVFKNSSEQKIIELPIPQGSQGTIKISISLPDAISPKDLGMSPDERKLGLSIESIKFL